jgi:hypothetical protein
MSWGIGTRVRSQGVEPKLGTIVDASAFGSGWFVVSWDDGETYDEWYRDVDLLHDEPRESIEVIWGKSAPGHTYGTSAAFREARRREAEAALMIPESDLHEVDEFFGWGYAVALTLALCVLGLVILLV